MLYKRSVLLLCVITTVSLSLVDGWKLRDISQRNDESKLSPKKPIFRDIPFRKVVSVERVTVNSAESTVSGEDDEAEVSNDDEDFTFEKVHTTNFDLPLKPVITLSNPDVEQEEEERIEEAKDTEEVVSWFSHLTSFSIFSWKVGSESPNTNAPQAENVSSGYFGWLTRANDKSTDSLTEEDTKNAGEISWFSYLKSLSVFTELLNSDDSSSSDNETKHRDKPDNLITGKREPLTTQSFENLLLSIPSFIPNYTKIDDIDCKRMGQIFHRQVRGQKLWALQSNNRIVVSHIRDF